MLIFTYKEKITSRKVKLTSTFGAKSVILIMPGYNYRLRLFGKMNRLTWTDNGARG